MATHSSILAWRIPQTELYWTIADQHCFVYFRFTSKVIQLDIHMYLFFFILFPFVVGRCGSVAKSRPTLCYPTLECSTPGFPVLHYLPEFAQTHVHCIGGATQPYFLSPTSPPT